MLQAGCTDPTKARNARPSASQAEEDFAYFISSHLSPRFDNKHNYYCFLARLHNIYGAHRPKVWSFSGPA
eukprot:scaffold528895_cov17-Prasinocladus_malaysianus.AAC.1